MSWLGFGKKRKRDEDVLDVVTKNIQEILKSWRDESGLGISAELSRVIGDDFANISIFGCDVVDCFDVVKFEELENVNDFVCDFKNGSIVLRVERRFKTYVIIHALNFKLLLF